VLGLSLADLAPINHMNLIDASQPVSSNMPISRAVRPVREYLGVGLCARWSVTACFAPSATTWRRVFSFATVPAQHCGYRASLHDIDRSGVGQLLITSSGESGWDGADLSFARSPRTESIRLET